MIKRVTILHRRQDLGWDQFSDYWRNVHGPLAQQIPGIRGYVQNHVLPGQSGPTDNCDGVGEMYFDSEEALKDGLASPHGQKVVADIANFLDTSRFVGFLVEEVNFGRP